MYDIHDLTRQLQKENGSKIVLLVADGLGGLPLEPGGKTALKGGAACPDGAHPPQPINPDDRAVGAMVRRACPMLPAGHADAPVNYQG